MKHNSILFVFFRNNSAGVGGGTTTMIEYANLLKKKYKIDFLLPFHIENLNFSQKIFLNNEKKWIDFKIPWYLIKFFRSFLKISNKYSIIFICLPNPSFLIIADFLKIISGKKVVVFIENAVNQEKLNFDTTVSFGNKLRFMINNPILARFNFKLCTYVVCSKFQKEQLIALGFNKNAIYRIPNLPKSTKHGKIPFKLNKKNSLLYYGHLNYEKGVDILLDSFFNLEKNFPDLKLFIVTNSNKNNLFSKVILKSIKNKRNVKLFFGKANVIDLLKNAKMVILPYRTQIGTAIYPSSILEAVKNNTLVISSKLPIIKEILPNSVLVNPNNASKELYNLITNFMVNDAEYLLNLKMEKSKYIKLFNTNNIKKNLIEVFE